eukprot:TRINITY_DN3422_c0_g1_i1.p1 TRINITY_DN3422_c0_g1~~TRINITY_DN3422_c0_g1_i1.p1  ORF type:complete len:155 (+),score=16.86 TRINITY_DN3422_c0_g1_i1:76-540(+)
MSKFGVPQLRKLVIVTAERHPSCTSLRDFLQTRIFEFKKLYPHIELEVRIQPNAKPHAHAYYLNSKIDPKTKEPLPYTVTLLQKNEAEIWQTLQYLRRRWGGKSHPVTKTQWSVCTSIQGSWHPFLNLNENKQKIIPLPLLKEYQNKLASLEKQ